VNQTIAKLRDLMNGHDAAALSALFSPDYRSQQPAHPNRGFGGHAQVATNWGNMFRGVPDLRAQVLAETTDGAMSWSEWIWSGHHPDGTPFEMRGVTILGLTDDGLIGEARLYMEPVERDGPGIDEAVQQLAQPSQ
jgi:ketosteroid isomerase-like protein